MKKLFVFVSLLGFLCPPPVEAQFLEKLNQKLKKVNNALEKVTSGKKNNPQTTNAATSPKAGNSASTEEAQPSLSGDNKTGNFSYAVPHFTDSTRFLLLDASEYDRSNPTITAESEGYFAIQGRGGNWSFYSVEDGACLFKSVATAIRQAPQFHSGVCVMRSKTKVGKSNPFVLLYKDGRVKELSPEITAITDFADGVAKVGGFTAQFVPYTYYIDINGQKIWPALEWKGKQFGGLSGADDIRPLRNGLRAVKVNGKWGYINPNGVMVITPQYAYCRDFSEGFALVCVKEASGFKLGLIDTKGHFAVPPSFKAYNQEIGAYISDVHDGRIRLVEGDNVVYYDTTGKEIIRYEEAKGTPFTDGYAWITRGVKSLVVDSDFNAIREVDDGKGFYSDPDNTKPDFSASGLAVVNFQRSVIRPDGQLVLQQQPDYDSHFEPFSAGGYALATSKFEDTEYRGFIRPDGAYTVVISQKPIDNRKWIAGNPKGPFPIDPPKPRGPLPPTDTLPKGPIQYDKPLPYRVLTSVEPEGSGSIGGEGEYKYGELATFTPIAKPGWKFSGLTATGEAVKHPTPNTFQIFGDAKVTAHFIKRDTAAAVPQGVWQTTYPYQYTTPEGVTINERIPLYLEMQTTRNVATPYGNKFGFLTLMFDPDKRYRSGQKKSTAGGQQYNIMFVPMAVEGMQTADSTTYLLLDGGEFKLGNILVESGEKDGGINAAAANLMLLLFGNDINIDNGSYRVSINFSPDNRITLGMMQRFHPTYGWIAAGDSRFRQVKTSGAMWGVESGLPSDYFNGMTLTPALKRDDIVWYAPKSWVWNDEAEWENLKKQFDKAYSNYLSDHSRFWNE